MIKNALNTLILDKIAQSSGKKIRFSDYMNLALYEPGLGYYANGSQKFGPQGDFITAPELTPLFGQCIAHALKDFTHILEFGAGSGKLAKVILDNHKNLEKYWILEPCAELQQRQKLLLKDYLPKIIWLDKLPEQPFTGAILANEVIDAFPVTKFLWKNNAVYEYFVGHENNDLILIPEKSDNKSLINFTSQLNLPENYSSEINFYLKPWLNSLSQILKSGVILILDYGFPRHEYYHLDRSMGTLMCHSRHKTHTDVLYHPGEQDITAHVDFTAVAEAAVENQLEVLGYTSQASFLLDNKLLDFAGSQTDKNHIKLLTHPSEMGELFKVIMLGKNWSQPVTGFQLQDRRHRL